MKKSTITFVLVLFVGVIYSQTLQWARGIGGPNEDAGTSIAVDGFGNVYTTGFFRGTVDFDPGIGILNLSTAGGDNTFISKMDPMGNFIWAKNLGGTGVSDGTSIKIDSWGNVYTTGYFYYTVDFDPGPGTFNLTAAVFTGPDIFISKLDSNGNFIWAKSMTGTLISAGTGSNKGFSIDLDPNGNVYATGSFAETVDFDPGAGIFNLVSAGYNDAFILKLDFNGNFIWAKRFGDYSYDEGYSIDVDSNGFVFTTGYFAKIVDFDPNSGVFNLLSNSYGSDIFISKLDSSGNFVWAKNLGGQYTEYGHSIALDASGNVYTTGQFRDTADFDPGTGVYNLISVGIFDSFISKLDHNGDFVWAKRIGGFNSDIGYSIWIDNSSNVHTTGSFLGTADFDPAVSNYTLTSGLFDDIFISKLDSNGNFISAKKMGGVNGDFGHSITVDGAGNIYTTGYFNGLADFDPPNLVNLATNGYSDIFIAKFAGNILVVDEKNLNIYFSVYPNPTRDFLNLKLVSPLTINYELILTNALGKIITKKNIRTENNLIQSQLDMKHLISGIYNLNIISNKTSQNFKILKQ